MPYKVGQRKVYLVGEKRDELPLGKDLPSGEVQDYVELKNAARTSGQPFVDPLFNPDTKDIVGTRSNGEIAITVPIKSWKRPRDVDKKYVFGEKDANGRRYGHDDLGQGRMGDCYYISAVSILSDNDELIDFTIPEDNNEEIELGIFHFRFWVNGYFFDIVVDDRVPYKNEKEVACARLMGNEFWPLLIEKAYAKLHGSYGAIVAGHTNDALEDFTGGIIRNITYDKEKEIPKWEDIVFKNHFGTFIGLGTNEGSDTHKNPDGLFFGHAYAVLGSEVITNNAGETVRLVSVRNPHGRNEWIGDWSDFPTPSAKWDTIPAADKDRLLKSEDNGQFWMSYEDVTNTKQFIKMCVCYWLPNVSPGEDVATQKLWEWKEIHGKWEGSNLGQGLEGAELNAARPQYRVHLKGIEMAESTLIVSIMWKGKIDKGAEHPSLNFKLFEVMDEGLVKDPLPYDAKAFGPGKLVQNKAFESTNFKTRSDREYCTGATLKDGHYVITPYNKELVEGKFLLRIICQGQVDTNATHVD